MGNINARSELTIRSAHHGQRHARQKQILMLVSLICVLTVIGCSKLPPHVIQANGTYQPEPGYTWVSDPSKDLHVRWNPGAPDPHNPHVFAATAEGLWVPGEGYAWVDPSHSLQVRWAPGSTHSHYPNIIAAEAEGQWSPAPGYSFVSTEPNDPNVRWSPGSPDPNHAHVVAYETEGSWVPEAGYDWADKDKKLVTWRPGSTSASYPHTVASQTEGHWVPAPGYSFMNDEPHDMRVTWTPGKPDPAHPHVVAYDTEGSWVPAAGYDWTDKDKRLVAWQPGTIHPQHAHVVADTAEGYWKTESGYRFVSNDSLEVTRAEDNSAANTLLRIGADLLGGAIASRLSKEQESDGPGMKYVVRPFFQAASDAASDDIKDALRGK